MINWALEKYKTDMKKTKQQQQKEHVIIHNIIDELEKKRSIAINKKKEALFKDDILIYRQEGNTFEYVLYMIREFLRDFIKSLSENPSSLICYPNAGKM